MNLCDNRWRYSVIVTDVSNAQVTIDVGECVQCGSESSTNVSLPVNTVSDQLYIICVMAAKEYTY